MLSLSGMERVCETPAGNARLRETPLAESRGGSRTARGKRAPVVERSGLNINL